MLILYRFGIWFYWIAVRMLTPFHAKAKKFSEGRKNWKARLHADFQHNSDRVVWFHAASLGEFEQGRPVMEELKKNYPEVKILLTFFSPSGYEIRKNYTHADWVKYLPLDTPKNAEFLIQTVKPTLAVFIKYEFWYFYLSALQKHGIPTLMISCIFRENQFYFRQTGAFFRPVLRDISQYFMQDENSVQLAKSIAIPHVALAGDTRFDRVLTIAQDAKEIPIMASFKGTDRLMILGSTWPSDIEQLLPLIEAYQNDLKFAIAPHNIDKHDIDLLFNQFPNAVKYSDAEQEALTSARILIVDNMGMLSSLYRYGDFAFIGGGFRGALHNTLEAAVYGIPVCFGEHPKNQKFKEAIGLLKSGGAFSFSSSDELLKKFKGIIHDDRAYSAVSTSAGNFVKEHTGATPLIMKKMNELLK